MKPVRLTVNGTSGTELVEPRMHLADLLREKLGLTGTHLRCEQGACGACTVLVDGQPARSCITYAVLCDGAEITTIEGLEQDPVVAALRQTFSQEHGLQCGYCTPGMLVTARDIILRLPEADERRIRLELSGNLCRCTGYVGIVRAIRRVLDQRRTGALVQPEPVPRAIGPVGSRRAIAPPGSIPGAAVRPSMPVAEIRPAQLGLDGQAPTLEMQFSLVVGRPQEEVWSLFGDLERVAACIPGVRLTSVRNDLATGELLVKLGPISSAFTGEASIHRDPSHNSGTVRGSGQDRLSGSRVKGELEYALTPEAAGRTRVDVALRAVLAGPLAQFGRSGIVQDVAGRLVQAFGRNVEQRLGSPAEPAGGPAAPLHLGSFIGAAVLGWMRSAVAALFGRNSR